MEISLAVLAKEKIVNTLDERAHELIESYALGHAGTAFSVGHLGGQFGADRVALTALTVKMINALCDLYGIHDGGARKAHLASAIARLTIRGTVVAHTLLNWIPVLGPGANSITTYFLTKQAGSQCINDIKNRRMTAAKQIGLALGRIAVTFGISEISQSIEHATEYITDDILLDVETHSELIASFLEQHAEVTDGTKYFLAHTVQSTSVAIANGEKPNMRRILESTFYAALLSELCSYHIKQSDNYFKDKDEILYFVKKTGLRDRFPYMSRYFEKLANKYEKSINDQELSVFVNNVAEKIRETLSFVRSNDIDIEEIIRVIKVWDSENITTVYN